VRDFPPAPKGTSLDWTSLARWLLDIERWGRDVTVSLRDGSSSASSSAGGTDFESFRHKPGNSSLSPWNIAGAVYGPPVAGVGNPAANTLFAFPVIAPKRGGTLSSIAWRGNGTTGNGRMGLYSNLADDNLYPGALLLDTGSIAQASTFLPTSVS